jgi:hypothetical protein
MGEVKKSANRNALTGRLREHKFAVLAEIGKIALCLKYQKP